MGVGYPEDLVVSVALGADMFDCVWPSRTAVSDAILVFIASPFCYTPSLYIPHPTNHASQRFGNAITSTGVLNLKHSTYRVDFRPISADCTCPCCLPTSSGGLGITRAYIYHVAAKETVGAHL